MCVEDLTAALRKWSLDVPTEGDPEFATRHECLDIAIADGRLFLLGLDQDGDLAFTLPTALDERRETVRLTKHGDGVVLDVEVATSLDKAIDDAQTGQYEGYQNYPGLGGCP
jgi:hypothetical protein